MTENAPRSKGLRSSRPKAKASPTVGPAPPPPKAKSTPKTGVPCSSGDDCPAVAEVGHPEKIRTTKGEEGYCDRRLRRRAEEATKDLEARRAGKLR